MPVMVTISCLVESNSPGFATATDSINNKKCIIYQLFAQSHQFLAILFISIEKLWEEVGRSRDKHHTHTHKINAREK